MSAKEIVRHPVPEPHAFEAFYPVRDLDNVLITSRTAGRPEKMWDRHYAEFAENLRRFCPAVPLIAVGKKLGTETRREALA